MGKNSAPKSDRSSASLISYIPLNCEIKVFHKFMFIVTNKNKTCILYIYIYIISLTIFICIDICLIYILLHLQYTYTCETSKTSGDNRFPHIKPNSLSSADRLCRGRHTRNTQGTRNSSHSFSIHYCLINF